MAPTARPNATAPASPTWAPSWARSKLTALMSAPAPNASTSPISRGDQGLANPSSAPMTSDDAASTPHPSAAFTSGTGAGAGRAHGHRHGHGRSDISFTPGRAGTA